MINIVVAYDERGAIGKDGDLPWGHELPADLAHFKQLTVGNRVLMGRKTFESIGHPLKDRENIVLSRNELALPAGVIRFGSLATALAYDARSPVDTFVIGGARVYEDALPYTDKIYTTEVHETFEGADTYFPYFDEAEWLETVRERHSADERNAYDYSFVEYVRNKKTAP
jgi:dihydrofolate reductase